MALLHEIRSKDPQAPSAIAPSIRARCEMDLSLTGRTLPRKGSSPRKITPTGSALFPEHATKTGQENLIFLGGTRVHAERTFAETETSHGTHDGALPKEPTEEVIHGRRWPRQHEVGLRR